MESPKSSKLSPLHRGEACLTCRKRKMKCDAGKPACAPCTRAGKADECEYEESRFQAALQKLEDENRELRTRIAQLEQPGTSNILSPISPPPLHVYVDSPGTSTAHSAQFSPWDTQLAMPALLRHDSHGGLGAQDSPSGGSSGSQASPFTTLLPYSSSPPTPLSADMLPYEFSSGHAAALEPTTVSPQWQRAPDDLPPHNTVVRLVDIFMPHAAQLGLVIDPTLFMSSLNQHHPSLMHAVCLWACHFAQTPAYAAHEPAFLRRATLHIARSLAARDRPVDALQAQCLLALYLFARGRLLEGYHHAGGAMRLAVALGLHQRGAENAFLAPPDGARDAEQRARAWWMVFALDRCWSTVLELPPALVDSDHPRAAITTPFPPLAPDDVTPLPSSSWSACLSASLKPLKVEPPPFDYLMPHAASPHHAADAAPHALLHLYTPPAHSFVPRLDTPASLLAKACALFQRASALAAAYQPDRQPSSAFWADLHAVGDALNAFPLSGAALGTRARAHAAAVRLHGVFAPDAARHAALQAARDAAHVGHAEFFLVDPFVGICWVHVGAFLHNDVYVLGRAELLPDLDAIVRATRKLAGVFPFLDIHAQQLETGRGPT